MSNQSQNNKRIAKNTLILYVRMLFTVGISFYSTRLILSNLGVSDYGVYNVIGGFVSMFYMVTSTMTEAVSRFLTFELGRNDARRLQQTFSTSVNILLLLALVIVVLGETVGLWFVNAKLNIESSRMAAANWIYQLSLLSFILEMISVPYSASVISHEKMGTFAFVTIAKVLLTFGIALSLAVSPIDKLVFYGILVLAVSVSIQLMYWFYCRKHFTECRYTPHIDKSIFKEMFGFAGWNFFSTVSGMISSQGVEILLNIFFGTPVNAARGIASQLKGTAASFYKNFGKAIVPQVTKSYAAGNIEYTRYLVCTASKFTYLLFLLPAIPICFETHFFLSVWLKDVPQYAIVFVKLQFIDTLILAMLNIFTALNNATGNIKKYQLLVGFYQFIIFPTAYIILKLGGNPYSIMYATITINVLFYIPRITFNERFIHLTFREYFKSVLSRCLLITAIDATICYIITMTMAPSWCRFLFLCTISSISIAVLTFVIGLNFNEKKQVFNLARRKFRLQLKA